MVEHERNMTVRVAVQKPVVHHYTAVLTIHSRDMALVDPVTQSRRDPATPQELKRDPRAVAKIVLRHSSLETLLEKVKGHLELVEDE